VTYIIYSNGDSTVPCGTPKDIDLLELKTLSIWTL